MAGPFRLHAHSILFLTSPLFTSRGVFQMPLLSFPPELLGLAVHHMQCMYIDSQHTTNRVKWTFYNQPYRSGTNITLDSHGENVYGGIYMVGGRGGLFLGNAACCDQ